MRRLWLGDVNAGRGRGLVLGSERAAGRGDVRVLRRMSRLELVRSGGKVGSRMLVLGRGKNWRKVETP
jgi:hypothetical protein